jgi:hypothetical protein
MMAWMAGEMLLGMRSLAAEVGEARSGAGIDPNSESTKARIAAMAKNEGREIEAGVCARSIGVKNGAAFGSCPFINHAQTPVSKYPGLQLWP